MTAASGDPGERPDNSAGQPAAGESPVPPHDPAYAPWPLPAAGPPGPPPVEYPAADYPPPPPPGFTSPPSGYPPPPPPYPWPAPGGYPMPPMPPPYAGGYPYPLVQPPRTNTLAIVSLVSSAFGILCCVGPMVGIITGSVALFQIRRTGEKGTAVAIAGIVVGILLLLVPIAALTGAFSMPGMSLQGV